MANEVWQKPAFRSCSQELLQATKYTEFTAVDDAETSSIVDAFHRYLRQSYSTYLHVFGDVFNRKDHQSQEVALEGTASLRKSRTSAGG